MPVVVLVMAAETLLSAECGPGRPPNTPDVRPVAQYLKSVRFGCVVSRNDLHGFAGFRIFELDPALPE